MDTRMRYLAVVTAVIGLAGLAACGGPPAKQQGGGAPAIEKSTKTYGSTKDPDAKGPAADVPGFQRGGTLTVLSSSAPHTFDPTRAYYLDVMNILKLVTRSLTQTKNVNGRPVLVPDIAEDLGRPSKDFKTWTFTIKKGIKYENGREVQAEDFAYSIKRQMAVNQLPDGATYGKDYYLDGDRYRGPWESGNDFKAVSYDNEARTITVRMREPFPTFNFYTTLPLFSPIPADIDKKDPSAYERDILATGPYKFEKYETGKRLILTRNSQWDPKTDPARHQYPDKFDFQFGKQDLKIQSQVLADRPADQATLVPNPILAEVYEANRDKLKDRMVAGSLPCTSVMWFDVRKIPLEVRRAIATAYPIESEYKVQGRVPGLTWNPATTIMPSITPGWRKYDAIGNGGKGDGDPKKARAILKKEGRVGFELSYYYIGDDPIAAKVSQVREQKLEAAGFQVKAVPVPKRQLRAANQSQVSPVNMRVMTWCIDWASGDTVFPAILNGTKADLRGAPIPSHLDVPDVNREIERIIRMPAEKGLGEWGRLDELIMRKYIPGVPFAEPGATTIRGSKVGNLVLDVMLADPDYTQIYVKK